MRTMSLSRPFGRGLRCLLFCLVLAAGLMPVGEGLHARVPEALDNWVPLSAGIDAMKRGHSLGTLGVGADSEALCFFLAGLEDERSKIFAPLRASGQRGAVKLRMSGFSRSHELVCSPLFGIGWDE